MNIRITINCDNDAFADGNGRFELSRILDKLAQSIGHEGIGERTLRDINGNTVGIMKVENGQ